MAEAAEVLVQRGSSVRQRGMNVRRAENYIIVAKKREHFDAVSIPYVPVAMEAREVGPVCLQFFHPTSQQGVNLSGAQLRQILPKAVAAIGSQELHLQVVSTFEAARTRLFHACLRSQGSRGGAHHLRNLGIRRGN